MGTQDENIQASQYLTFILRDEHFAVEIFRVREVLDFAALTRIPRMPDHICGVINLRGSVVPVVDLGLQLGMAPVERTVNTCIMIMEIKIEGDHEVVQMGVLTDAVQEVISLNRENIEEVPKMGTSLNTDFIKGMGRQDEKFIILLDVDKVLTSQGEAVLKEMEDAKLLDSAAATANSEAAVEVAAPE